MKARSEGARPGGVPFLRLLIALAVGLYLYFLLPLTATGFYELYHLTGVDAIYWGYSAFKAAGYYFGTWEYRVHTCLAVAALILVLPWLFGRLRGRGRVSP